MDEGFLSTDGVRLAFRDSGTRGRDVVLVHGGFSNLEYFAGLAAALAERHRVVSYDLRGHGQSGAGPNGLADHGDDLCAVITGLELERPFVIGASFGAFVALEVAARESSPVGGIVNLDGPLVDRDDAADWTPDHPSWAARRAAFRASIAARPDQWSGSRKELDSRLSEVPEANRAFEARKYVESGNGGYVEHPDADTSADLLLTSKGPTEHYYARLFVPALVLVASLSGVIFDDVERRQAGAKRLKKAHPKLDVRVIEGDHDLVGDSFDEVVTELSRWLATVPRGDG